MLQYQCEVVDESESDSSARGSRAKKGRLAGPALTSGVFLVGLGVLVLLTLLPASAPLGDAGGASECAGGTRLTVGQSLQPKHTVDVRLLDASLYRPRHLRLIGFYLVRVVSHRRGGDEFGLVEGFPPRRQTIPSDLQWEKRATVGQRVRLEAGGSYNVVFGVERTGRVGRAANLQFTYASGGSVYRWSSGLVLKIGPRACH